MLNTPYSELTQYNMRQASHRFVRTVQSYTSRLNLRIFNFSKQMHQGLVLGEIDRAIDDFSGTLRNFNKKLREGALQNEVADSNFSANAEEHYSNIIQAILNAATACKGAMESGNSNVRRISVIFQNLSYLFKLSVEMMQLAGGNTSIALNRLNVLNFVLEHNDAQLLYHLHHLGADFNTRNSEGETILQCAIKLGNLRCILEVLQYIEDIDARNSVNLETALHTTVRQNNIAVADLLIRNNANILIKDGSGYSPLYLAFYCKKQEFMEYFVPDKKLRINILESIHNKSAGLDFDTLVKNNLSVNGAPCIART